MIKNPLRFVPAVLVALVLPQGPLSAAIIPGVTISDVSSQQSNSGADQRTATNLVNGSGLFGSVHTWNITGSGWLTSDASVGAYSNAYVVFDLGAVHNLSKMRVYNYNEASTSSTFATSNGVQKADLLFGTSIGTYTTTIAGQTFNKAPGTITDFSQSFNLTNLSARYVRINVQTNFLSSSNRVGLCKVLFYDTNIAPTITMASRNFSSNAVTLWFSDVVTAATATNIGNYLITGGSSVPTILSATLGQYGDNVTLLTSPLTNNTYTVSVANVATAADGTVFNNTPVPIQSQLTVWLKGDVGVITNASGVAEWDDQSGNGNNAYQTNSALQPVVAVADINSLSDVNFTGSRQLDIAFSSSMSLPYDYTIFAVMKVNSPVASNNEIVSRAVSNRAAPFDYRYTSTAGNIYRGNEGGGGSFSNAGATSNFPANKAALVTALISGTNGTHYLNGLLNGSAPVIVGFRDSQGIIRVGGRDDNAVHLSGNIAELMIIRGGVSSADRLAINAYLGAKWGITITDLSFTQQPTNTTATQGLTATFNATATSSSTNLITYQWATNGVAVSGATNTSYTTPTLTLADSGKVFSVVATSGTNTVTSSNATLTVVADTTAPLATYAGKLMWNSNNNVEVVFSEPVSSPTATTTGNYALNNGATVTSATFGDSAKKILLTISGLTSNTAYNVTVQNVQDLFGNTIVTTNLNIGYYPQLALWLRSDLGVTADGSGNVSEWDDQSGNGNNGISPGGSYSPVYIPSDFNGLPALRFNGVSSLLDVPDSASLHLSGDLAIYAVLQFANYTNANGNEVISKTAGTAKNIPASFDFYAGPGSGRIRFYRGNGGSGGSGVSYQNLTANNAAGTNSAHIVVGNSAGTTLTQYLDGITNGVATLTAGLGDGATDIGIGARNDLFTNPTASPVGQSDMAEIMLFAVGLSTSDRSNLDLYLGSKYAIFIGVAPTLTISGITSTGFVLSWPTPSATFNLESTASLAPSSWSVATNIVNTSAGTNSTTVNSTTGSRFYRLHKQ